MFERFTADARAIVVKAQEEARQLGHHWIGCEHILVAIARAEDATGAVLRDAQVTPERVRAELLRMAKPAPGAPVNVFDTLDREALAAIGIDLDVVRGKVEEIFGPHALLRMPRTTSQRPRRWWKRPHARYRPGGRTTFHSPFTMRAKKCLELSVRESHVRHSGHIGVEHIALGLLRADSSAVTHVLSELGVSAATLRMEILNRYRQAS